MEFTRDLLQKLERNAERSKGLSKEQALKELDRNGVLGERSSSTGTYASTKNASVASRSINNKGPKGP